MPVWQPRRSILWTLWPSLTILLVGGLCEGALFLWRPHFPLIGDRNLAWGIPILTLIGTAIPLGLRLARQFESARHVWWILPACGAGTFFTLWLWLEIIYWLATGRRGDDLRPVAQCLFWINPLLVAVIFLASDRMRICRQPRCADCDYDLRGSTNSPRCPECGRTLRLGEDFPYYMNVPQAPPRP